MEDKHKGIIVAIVFGVIIFVCLFMFFTSTVSAGGTKIKDCNGKKCQLNSSIPDYIVNITEVYNDNFCKTNCKTIYDIETYKEDISSFYYTFGNIINSDIYLVTNTTTTQTRSQLSCHPYNLTINNGTFNGKQEVSNCTFIPINVQVPTQTFTSINSTHVFPKNTITRIEIRAKKSPTVNTQHYMTIDSTDFKELSWWNATYPNRYPINCSNITTGTPIVVNGGSGISINSTTQIIWTRCEPSLYLYYISNLNYAIANDTDKVAFEVEIGNVTSYNTTQVWNSDYAVVYHLQSTANVSDSTSNARTGTIGGGTSLTTSTSGKVGNSIDFSTNGWITVPSMAWQDPSTIILWIKSNSSTPATYTYPYARFPNTKIDWQIYTDNNIYLFGTSSNGLMTAYSDSVDHRGNWTMVTYRWATNDASFLINGNLLGTDTSTGGSSDAGVQCLGSYLSASACYNGYTFLGSLDEYRHYNVKLDTSIINQTFMNILGVNGYGTLGTMEVGADTTNPTIVIDSPTNNGNYTTTTININITATDDTGLDKITENLNGTNVTWTTGHQYIFPQNGTTIYAYVNDTAGNQNSSSATFWVDSIYPSIYVTSPTNGTISGNFALDISYVATDSNLSKCSWSDDGGTTNNSIATCGDNLTGVWVAGRNNVTIYANDTLGNTNLTTVYFDIDKTVPVVTFSAKIPADLNITNTLNSPMLISYIVTDNYNLDNATVKLFYKANSTTDNNQFYQNGTAYAGFFDDSFSLTPRTNSGSNFTWTLLDNEVYPGTFNFGAVSIDNLLHTKQTFINPISYIMTEFYNISNTKERGYFEIMANSTTTANPVSLYYCNNSYDAGNIASSTYCSLIATRNATSTFDHCHTNASCHIGFQFAVNSTTNTIGTVGVTERSYFVLGKSTNWNYFTILNYTRVGMERTSITNGVTWTNETYTVDAHLHQFDNDENQTFWWYACANDTIGNSNCSSASAYNDTMELDKLPPTSVNIYSPTNQTYDTNITINYSSSTSPSGNVITNYSIDLLFANYTFNQTIHDNAVNLTYYWNTTSITAGEYRVRITAIDNESLASESFSDNFTIGHGVNMSVTITNATNKQWLGQPINLTLNQTGGTFANLTVQGFYPNGTSLLNYSCLSENCDYDFNIGTGNITGIYSFNGTGWNNYNATNSTETINITIGSYSFNYTPTLPLYNYTSEGNAWIITTNGTSTNLTSLLAISIYSTPYMNISAPLYFNWTSIWGNYSNYTIFNSANVPITDNATVDANTLNYSTENLTANLTNNIVMTSANAINFTYTNYSSTRYGYLFKTYATTEDYNIIVNMTLANSFNKGITHPQYKICTGVINESTLGCSAWSSAVDVYSLNNGVNSIGSYSVNMKVYDSTTTINQTLMIVQFFGNSTGQHDFLISIDTGIAPKYATDVGASGSGGGGSYTAPNLTTPIAPATTIIPNITSSKPWWENQNTTDFINLFKTNPIFALIVIIIVLALIYSLIKSNKRKKRR